MALYSVDKLIAEARRLAADYRRATGKSLPGVSGEIAEHDAAHALDLELCKQPQGGYDAIGRGEREGWRVQIKARAIFDGQKSGQRIGQLKLDQDWDSVVLVLMNEDFDSFEMYEAEREVIEEALAEGSTRGKRGPMSISRFKNIARLVWTLEDGLIRDEVWDNRSNP